MGRGNDTPLFWRNQPGGPATIINKPDMGTGKFWWVDSNAGADASNATGSDQAPCLTIAAAVTLAAANLALDSRNNAHTILLKEGHAESLTAAIALSTAGIKIIALGTQGQRATLTMITNATAAFTVTGANCKIQGINFVCNIADTTEFIDVAADDLEICDCTLKEGSAVTLSMITADTTDAVGDNLYIHHNYFTQPSAGNGNQAIELAKDYRNVRIEYNRMYGDWDEACIQVPAAGDACTEIQIHNNDLSNLLTGQHAIQLNGTAITGSITGNMCQTDTQAATIDKSACFASGNMWLDVDGTNDEEAVPVNPTTTSATTSAPGLGGINDTTTDSVNGKLGTDTEMSDSSIFDMLGGGGGFATWLAAAAPANGVSLAEGLRYLSELQAPRTAVKESGDLTSFGTSMTLFTVTGDVWAKVGATIDVAVTCTSGTSTLEVGVAGNTAALCIQDAVDATAFDIGDSWTLISPPDTNAGLMADEYVLIGNGVDIILTGSVDDMTAGEIDFYCQYIPCNSSSSVVAA